MNMKTEILLIASMLLALPLVAADDARPAQRPAEATRRAPGGLSSPISGVSSFEQVLTEPQRQKLREYTQANAGKARASQQEAIKMRRELQDAVLNGNAGEAAIKEKTEAIAKLEAEAFAARLNAMAKVAATLTPEQKEKVKQMGEQVRAGRSGLGAREREAAVPGAPREPAAPPPSK
jgi:Spy/CpxP family protein refolding chaperone